MKILIVDDEEYIRDMVGEFLESEGHQVLVAWNGKEGLEIARREAEALDLIILDNKMPVMSGWDLLRKLRSEKNNVAVLVATGHSELDETSVSEYGVVGVLEKPFSLNQLKSFIRKQNSKGT